MVIPILTPANWDDYELIDTGAGEKLERFGLFKLIRLDPRIIWPKRKNSHDWDDADLVFNRNLKNGQWIKKSTVPDNWIIKYNDLKFRLSPTDFRHVGIFPEQAVNWDWITNQINHQPLKILNLFAYTGGATIVAAKNGANVIHVDSSKPIITWANNNASLNNLTGDSVRWILDDAEKFVEREIRRGNIYDGIIADPPRFGHGRRGEIWKLEQDLERLIKLCKSLLTLESRFLLLNAYTADISAIALSQLIGSSLNDLGGQTEVFELALRESGQNPRFLPSGISVRWFRN